MRSRCVCYCVCVCGYVCESANVECRVAVQSRREVYLWRKWKKEEEFDKGVSVQLKRVFACFKPNSCRLIHKLHSTNA